MNRRLPHSCLLFVYSSDAIIRSLNDLTAAFTHTYIVDDLAVQRSCQALYSMASGGRYESVYDTANSFDPEHEALNSTLALDRNTQGSADMSIEAGRGIKRAARDAEDISQSDLLTFDNDDQRWQSMGTPPLRARVPSTNLQNSALRKEAMTRKASEAKANGSAKRVVSGVGRGHTSLADALRNNGEDDTMLHVTQPSRNTRFARPAKSVGAQQNRILSGSTLEGSKEDPKDSTRPGSSHKNATVQSTGSFLIPDIDGVTALIGGTPAMPRSTKRSSRFTPSANWRMPSRSNRDEHFTLTGVPVPDDARRVYSGIDEAVARIAALEMEKDAAASKAEDYEALITELRVQLAEEQHSRRPDSGFGSGEEASQDKWRRERAQLETQVKMLRERLASTHETTVKRITQERAEYYQKVEEAMYTAEELKLENEQFRESHLGLQEENAELREEVAALQEENDGMKALMAKAKKSEKAPQLPVKEMGDLTLEVQQKHKKRGSRRARELQQHEEATATQQPSQTRTRRMSYHELDDEAHDNIAQIVQREMQRIQEAAAKKAQAAVQDRAQNTLQREHSLKATSKLHRQVSRGHERRASAPANSRRAVSAPVESSASEAESESEAELTSRTRQTLQGMKLPSPAKGKPVKEDTANLTLLSNDMSYNTEDIRRFLEANRMKTRATRHASAPIETELEPTLTQKASATASAARRKSSMRDITSDLQLNRTGSVKVGEDTTKLPKTVRVQSPAISDAPTQQAGADDVDNSVLSKNSRRRRRASVNFDADHEEGETSAFIIPDITIRDPTTGLATAKVALPAHQTGACTICAEANGKHIDVPLPIAVSTRDSLGDDATLRPAWAPHLSLAHVLKQLQDEVAHLKLQLARHESAYNAHDPALGRRKRLSLDAEIGKLRAEIEKRSEQVYRLYDVVEAHQAEYRDAAKSAQVDEVEETLQSIGMDPAEVSGRLGRSAPEVPEGLRDVSDGEESVELPWGGFSDEE